MPSASNKNSCHGVHGVQSMLKCEGQSLLRGSTLDVMDAAGMALHSVVYEIKPAPAAHCIAGQGCVRQCKALPGLLAWPTSNCQ